MSDVTVAVHQPNYLPWLGYFHKIHKANIFVFLDTVQFARRGYSHRVHVMGPGRNSLWLTQHIQRQPREEQIISQVRFSDRQWINKHLKTLEASYRKSPHFPEVFSILENILQNDSMHLSLFNGYLTRQLCQSLGNKTRILYASELTNRAFSSPSERIAWLTAHVGGTRYLSGAGAKAYNDPEVFAHYGIELAYNEFCHRPYPQQTQTFLSGLSIVDALFNIGFSGVSDFLSAQ